MRHGNSGRKFDRNTSHRRAMFRNLTANLVLHERIETTDAKAKELRRVAERLLTKAMRLGEVAYTAQEQLSADDKARRLHAQRLVSAYIPRFGVRTAKGGETTKVDLVEKIFLDLAKRFKGRPGGYTRIVKLGPRRGDNAPISIIEFVGELGAADATKAAAPAAGVKAEYAGDPVRGGPKPSSLGGAVVILARPRLILSPEEGVMATMKGPPPLRVAPPALKTPTKMPPLVARAAAPPTVTKAGVPLVAKAAPASSGSSAAEAGEAMRRETLVIAFVDLGRFQIASRRVKDDALVALLEDYYARIVDGLKPAGGRVVKFMGDGALVVFAGERVSQAARALLMLKADVDARLAKRDFATPLVVRLHAGEAMAGAIGPQGERRFDVIGHAVNRAAAIRAGEPFALTRDAFVKLDAKTQKLFKAKGDYFVSA